MPDKRRHRGQHPDDERLFAEEHHQTLRLAVADYAWLLTHGYAQNSALKLVGDRFNLTDRQRTAIMRSTCTDQALERRTGVLLAPRECTGRRIMVDGYNLLITVESALSGGLILVGRDGCYRDLASVHGTYRRVEETAPALRLIFEHIDEYDIARVDWYLDRPVSNSGRLRAMMLDMLKGSDPDQPHATPDRQRTTSWNVELADSPDATLIASADPVVTSDSAILDRCGSWVNLAADIIDTRIPNAWKVDLGV